MLVEINRQVLEQFVKDKEFMYQLVSNWTIETHEHYGGYGLGLHIESKSLSLRPRGFTQISIKYYDYRADSINGIRDIEKRIVKYKKL